MKSIFARTAIDLREGALGESEIMNDGRILLLHILLVSCFAFHSLQWGIFVWDHTIEVIMENKFNSSSIST